MLLYEYIIQLEKNKYIRIDKFIEDYLTDFLDKSPFSINMENSKVIYKNNEILSYEIKRVTKQNKIYFILLFYLVDYKIFFREDDNGEKGEEKEYYENLEDILEEVYKCEASLIHCEILKNFRDCFLENNEITLEIIQDQIASEQLKKAYPHILEIENYMRALILKMLILKGSKDEWVQEIPEEIAFLTKKDGRVGIFSFDFSHLAKILFEKNNKSSINNILSLIENMKNCNQENFNKIKEKIPKSNWERYFKEYLTEEKITNNELSKLLKDISQDRNCVAHNNLHIPSDFLLNLIEKKDKLFTILNNIFNKLDNDIDLEHKRNIYSNLKNHEKDLIEKIKKLEEKIKLLTDFNKYKEKEVIFFLKNNFNIKNNNCFENMKYYFNIKNNILNEFKTLNLSDVKKYTIEIDELIEKIPNCFEIIQNEDNNVFEIEEEY